MADLGAISQRDPTLARATYLHVTKYNVVRGKFLGVIQRRSGEISLAPLDNDLSTYIVRQIRILYRQIWPAYGQRFPQ